LKQRRSQKGKPSPSATWKAAEEWVAHMNEGETGNPPYGPREECIVQLAFRQGAVWEWQRLVDAGWKPPSW
jgi:hypothetical protein